MGDLTRRESDFLSAIRDHVATDGIAPTREELRQALGWKSVSTVTLYLKRLVAKGRLEVVPRSSRGIRIAKALDSDGRVPIVRRVLPDTSLRSDENVERTISAEAAVAIFGTQPDFCLRIQRESAAGSGLQDGDLVAVRKASDAHVGEMVVASVDGKVTIGRARLANGRITLAVGSQGNAPAGLNDEGPDIKGVVIASVRSHQKN